MPATAALLAAALVVALLLVLAARAREPLAAGPAFFARGGGADPLALVGLGRLPAPAGAPAAPPPRPAAVPADAGRDGPTGQLFSGPRAGGVGGRLVYGADVSFGERWGMREYSSGVSGEVGVDVGPHVRMQKGVAPERGAAGDFYDPESEGVALGYGRAAPAALRMPDHDPLTT